MTNEREKEEAKVALEELLHQIQVIHLELELVRNWGYFDLFGDGMLVSWIKRRKMSKVNQLLIDLQATIQNCQKELADVDRLLLTEIPNTSWDKTLDIWLDNPVTDWRVIKESKHLLKAVEDLETTAKSALAKLT
ncbi:UNVERIFIED_CONTAM: hypothetical protein KB573_07070 [Streptococcus canis]|uniref:Uncharacterized protein n=1 Tax=Streptococcus canis FSL Z3-227 TaxID=482234 RepID=A0AAV3FUN4_STRCB|nr:hypothetical protein [Streptococcus canis]EIQ82479.1 hypothetical protein SCAZ3_08970 [Streptococcus canis FSL Z3-227]MDV5988830.1 hypothetical protein [Streptococcus canis]MDV5994083.1 hypothetical protein [Streptococcus canis]MDV6001740.1 hypothetical protein [Streptococcus canis]MDV6022606.1 hypothetical protein [Streptococcus canis]